MATLGYTGNGNSYLNLSTYLYYVVKTQVCSDNGVVDNFHIRMNPNNLTGFIYKVAIYKTDGTRVYRDTSNRNYPSGTSYAWRTLTLQSSAKVEAATQYYLLLYGQSDTYPRISALIDEGYYLNVGAEVFPDPLPNLGGFVASHQPSAYISYTADPTITGKFTHVDHISKADIQSMGGVDADNIIDLIGLQK